MARRNEVSADKVVWIAPEVLDRARGEYRIVEGDEETHEGARSKPIYGDRVVWVDDTPDDPTDGAGHFERYTGADDEYRPTITAGSPGDEGDDS